jgi:putative mRNA 3-end processing factor
VAELIEVDDRGLSCAAGGFHVDPWLPVPQAVLTHGHGDHARPGSALYHCVPEAVPVLRRRLGPDAKLVPHRYGEPFALGAVTVSLHPAGHVLGSAQVRVEAQGEVWVVSGDYKRQADPTCAPFEVLPCDVFITEATFALPIYRWPSPDEVARDILEWWEHNRAHGRASVLFCYALGKAQRILAHLAKRTVRPVHTHGTVEHLTALYREAGVDLLPTVHVGEDVKRKALAGELVLAPPSARRTAWMKRMGDHQTAFASGWMQLRGTRRRRAYDRGFVLSDHADWPALLETIAATGARQVRVTHGHGESLVRYLRERGTDAQLLRTPFGDEPDEREEG